eukprot:TRINITY_DN15390_c0_g1_i1.p1 TRINITY_DN15390_c0_g1~~TRINITY_DN15390_c0_g1_i1.p1  ORF type:complete len:214 (-),score=8.17 TRINITY_DN15390_c0_g1_i1:27-668(-)
MLCSSKAGIFFALLAILCLESLGDSSNFDRVTCGSVIKLTHKSTGFKLHSHEIPYGTGSKQQSVTGFPGSDDANSYWIVRGPHSKTCRDSEPIKCGSQVRLQHSNTRRNLHSHLHNSPLSNQGEVSAYGDEQSGDTGDNWRVDCDGKFWARGESVRLVHVDTNKYLYSSTQFRYPQPIAGQQEISCSQRRSGGDTDWTADEGVYFAPRRRKSL